MPLDSMNRFSVQDVCQEIAALMAAAMQFVPARHGQETMRKWLPRKEPAGASEDRLVAMAADALLLSADLLLTQPSLTGATAFDRLARGLPGCIGAQAAAMGAMRQARFRLLRLETISGDDAVARDLKSGETLRLVGVPLPTATLGLTLFARVAPLGQGQFHLPGAVTPLDQAAANVAMRHQAAGAMGLAANARWAEAVYSHVVRNGTLDIPGLNRPSEEPPPSSQHTDDPLGCGLFGAWIALDGATPGAELLSHTRQHADLPSILAAVTILDGARKVGNTRRAAALERMLLVILETLLRRAQGGMANSVTLDAVGAAIDQHVSHGTMPASARTAFAELRLRLVGGSTSARADDPGLERLMARIQGLRAKTVANGCTEQEALAAAEKVAEMLDRYGLSLGEMDFRAQACEGIGIQTTRKRMAPIDDCVTGIAAFFDCRVWIESAKGAPLRYVFFGLRADVAAAQYLYEMVERAFETETDAFRRGPIYEDMEGERRSATNSFQIGLARGISAKLRALRDERSAHGRTSGGRDLVVVKADMVEEELAKLGLNLQARSTASRSRRVLSDAYAAGEAAGQRFEFTPGIAMAAE
jgi:microcompartment protein CcmK/EutM